jgi:hypothetical protein
MKEFEKLHLFSSWLPAAFSFWKSVYVDVSLRPRKSADSLSFRETLKMDIEKQSLKGQGTLRYI